MPKVCQISVEWSVPRDRVPAYFWRSFLRPCTGLHLSCIALTLICLLSVPAAAAAFEVRVNCGDEAYEGTTGQFLADQPYAGNAWGYEDGATNSNWVGRALGGTQDPVLYWSVRISVAGFHYRFDVPNGEYDVVLRGVEVDAHWSGVNEMRVAAEGQTVVDGLDIFAEVERAYALDMRFRVPVSDGRLDLDFVALGRRVQIAAIEVVSADVVPGAPVPVEALEVTPGYASLIVDWEDSPDSDLKGYEVSRRLLPIGFWVTVQDPEFLLSRFVDQSVTDDAEYAYRVTAYDLDGLTSPVSNAVSAEPKRRADSALRDYELVMTEQDIDLLNEDIWSSEYRPADFFWGALSWPDVGVRYRGQSNRSGPKKNWKIRFDLEEIESMDRLNLNSGYADPSMIREALGFRLAERVGGHTCRTERVNLFLNGKHRGIHTQIEQIDGDWLDYRGFDPNSIIFKCNAGLFWVPSGDYTPFYERKTEPEDDLQPIEDLIRTIHLTSDEAFPDSISQLVDLHQFMNWYCTMIVTGNRDFATHNYYLIQDGATGRWSFVLWDLDVSLGAKGTYIHNFDATTPIDMGTVQNPDVRGTNSLIERFLEFPKFRWMYAQSLVGLLDGPLALPNTLEEFDQQVSLIAEDVPADFHKWGWENTDIYDQHVAGIETYIQDRHTFLTSEAEDYLPANVEFGVYINEFLASNSATNPDEFGEFDDWIELVNLSLDTLSLGGMFLSDDLSEPRKWAFPDVSLPPREFLIVWADDDPNQGPLHTNFKLNAGGEVVALWDRASEGNVLIDSHSFGQQTTDVSMAKIPDGVGDWVFSNPPTPGAVNGDPASVPEASATGPVMASGAVHAFPNPATDRVKLVLEEWTESIASLGAITPRVGIYDAAGRQIAELALPGGSVSVSLQDLFPRTSNTVLWIRRLDSPVSEMAATKLVWLAR